MEGSQRLRVQDLIQLPRREGKLVVLHVEIFLISGIWVQGFGYRYIVVDFFFFGWLFFDWFLDGSGG